MMDKASLRQKQRASLATLARVHPGAGPLLVERAITLHLERYSRITFYHPLPGEIDPLPLIDYLAARGAIIALPRVQEKNQPLGFHRWRPGDALSKDTLGLTAPTADADTVLPTLVVAPLLGFDRFGHRLGRGGGYYDRTIAALRLNGSPVAFAGLAYREQEVDKVPNDPHDVPLDFVITPAGILAF